MKREWNTAIRMTIATLVITGVLYPLAMTGIAQALFPHRANGSLVTVDGRVVGSELIGQSFSSPAYFRGRPSAAGAGYDPAVSSGSNLGPTSKKLRGRVAAEVGSLRVREPGFDSRPVPPELVSASGSGLDPDLSLDAALWQIPRVAAVRGVSVTELESLVLVQLKPRDLGILGEPRVNVLLLNLAVDAQYGRPPGEGG